MKKGTLRFTSVGLVVAVLCVLLVMWNASPAAAGTVYRYVLQWSTTDHGGLDVSEGAFGYIYVLESEGGRAVIRIYKPRDGSLLNTWYLRTLSGDNYLSASDVVVDAAGNAYVTLDNYFGGNHLCHVTKFAPPLGAAQETWGASCGSGDQQFDNPQGIDMDSSGNIYVADSGNHRIQIIKTDGTWEHFGTAGSGPGQFAALEGMAVSSDGYIYVLDGQDRVQKFDTSGNFIEQWGGTYGGGLDEFRDPAALDVDADGNVFVADTENNRIKKYSADGSLLTVWGTQGSDNGELNDPRGITVDKTTGAVYVADDGNDRVQKFKGYVTHDTYLPVVLRH